MLGLYAGSFDPPTLGHMDIIERAAAICDRLIVGVGANPGKPPFLSAEIRCDLVKGDCKERGLDNVEVVAFQGATVELARERNVDVLYRGMRGSIDVDRERGLAAVNRGNGVDTCYLMSRGDFAHISATLVKEVVLAGLSLDGLVSARVAAALMHEGAIRQRARPH